MHRTRVYVDTSVFGGTQDDEFCEPSLHFFRAVAHGAYGVLVSDMTYDELAPAPEPVRAVLEAIPEDCIDFVPITPEAEDLAQAYIKGGALGQSSQEDALHVALATVAGADLILSWNFKHIVNYQRIRKFNAMNILQGYKTLDIRSPLEIVDEEII